MHASALLDDIVPAMREKYLDAFRRLTGKEFSAWKAVIVHPIVGSLTMFNKSKLLPADTEAIWLESLGLIV